MIARVCYFTKDFLNALLGGTPQTRKEFERYYRKLCEIEGNSLTLEDIFFALNTNEHLQELLQFKAVVIGHTSMCVGDIVEMDGKYFICRSIGWEEIFFEK